MYKTVSREHKCIQYLVCAALSGRAEIAPPPAALKDPFPGTISAKVSVCNPPTHLEPPGRRIFADIIQRGTALLQSEESMIALCRGHAQPFAGGA